MEKSIILIMINYNWRHFSICDPRKLNIWFVIIEDALATLWLIKIINYMLPNFMQNKIRIIIHTMSIKFNLFVISRFSSFEITYANQYDFEASAFASKRAMLRSVRPNMSLMSLSTSHNLLKCLSVVIAWQL